MKVLGAPELTPEIEKGKKGVSLFNNLEKNGFIRPRVLFEFIKIQKNA
jgi:hypothetical protein